MRRSLPTQERLRALFSYQDGKLIWRHGRGKILTGDVAGHLKPDGYVAIGLDYAEYKAHRLVWKWHHGSDPEILDHVNGVRHDNRIENLEEVTNRENCNRGRDKRITLPRGVRCVRGKYQARILIAGKRLCLGTFGTIEEAADAYRDALDEIESSGR